MAGSVADINIKVVANASGVSTGLKQAEGALRRFEGASKGIGLSSIGAGFRIAAGQVSGFASALTGAGLALGGAAFGAAIKGTISRLDDLSDRAGGIGETARNLDQLGYVATRLGSSGDAAEKGISKLIRSVGDAAAKGGEAGKAFEALGLDVNSLAQLSPAEAFITTAQAIAELPTVYDKASAAAAIFGKSFADLMPLFSDPSGIEAFAADYEKLHGNVGQAAETASAAQDQFDRLSEATKGFGENMVVALGPSITTMVENMADALGRLNNNKEFMDSLTGSVRLLGDAFNAAAPYFSKAYDLLDKMTRLAVAPLLGLLDQFGITRSQTGTGAVNQAKLDKWRLRGAAGNAVGQDISRRIADANGGGTGWFDAFTQTPQTGAAMPASTSDVVPGISLAAGAGSGTALAEQYALQQQQDALDKEQEKRDKEMASSAERLTESLRTPWEEYQDAISKAQEMIDSGLISQETFFRATEKAWNDYTDALDKAQKEQDKLLNPDGAGGGYTNLSVSGGDMPGMAAMDAAYSRLADYNTLPGGYVGDLAPRIPWFTPPEWGGGRQQIDPSQFDGSYGMDRNNAMLAEIARNTREAGMVA